MNIRHLRFYLLGAVFLIAVSVSWAGLSGSSDAIDVERLRTRLLTHLIRQQMTVNHFSHKSLDDNLSTAAFDLYIQSLDAQKRFFTRSDIDQLRGYRESIDDAIVSGDLELVKVAPRLLRLRIGLVSGMVSDILRQGFDLNREEYLETDPDKNDYAGDEKELQARWRKILKYQVLMRYVQLYEEHHEAALDTAAIKPAPLDDALLGEAIEKVRNSTRHLLSRLLEQSEEDHFERFINAFVRAFDPHSAYLAPDALEDFEIYMKGSLEGIGATLREDDGFIRVVEIIPGSPAAKQGQLTAEDIILKVGEGGEDPVDVTETRLRDAVRLIRGKKGSEVHLTIRKPTGAEKVISIIRDVVEIEEGFAHSTTVPVSGREGAVFGYLRIPSFYRDFEGNRQGKVARNVTDDVRRELSALNRQGISGLVLDLRNNGGGALADAISIAGLFIPTGPVVQVKNHDGEIRVFTDDDPGIAYNGPLVVLVNRFSASASEILAGAIQDYGRGVVIGGEGTHGKGTVQAIFNMDQPLVYSPLKDLEPLGALKVTVQKFYRINGGSTQVKGVVPDIRLPDRLAFLESGEKYIEHALPWDTVQAVSYRHWSHSPDIPYLRALSEQRIANGHQFDELVAETRRNLQQSKETLRSLKLADALAELNKRREFAAAEDVDLPAEEDVEDDNLAEEIADDLYVGEALAVLADINRGVAAGEPRVAGQSAAGF